MQAQTSVALTFCQLVAQCGEAHLQRRCGEKRSSEVLVLSRKQNESIRIGDTIEIVVSQIQKNRVRLAISAPPTLAVHRKEVAERIAREDRSPFNSER
jgi:carbon storage regulator